MNDRINHLITLYQISSKHSNYQILPKAVSDLIPSDSLTTLSRYEKERMDFLRKHMVLEGKRILDIGGNTGYFSFESLAAGALEVTYIEGNPQHAEFVHEAASILDAPLKAINAYADFDSGLPGAPYDVILLFNVLHHFGDDFGDSAISIEEARNKIKKSIQSLNGQTRQLVLQLGFCWKGNRNHILFGSGSKQEMIDFVKEAVNGYWEIEHIGIAEGSREHIGYAPLNDDNIQRRDDLGEFLNRPIFILRTLKSSL